VSFTASDVSLTNLTEASPIVLLLKGTDKALSDRERRHVADLISDKVDLNATDKDKRTALIYAVRLGDLETTKLLVEAGAYVKIRDRWNKTALFYAVEAHRRDIVNYLASNGDLQSSTPQERKERGRR
jgi:ankyrin repeat protein